MTDQAYWLHHLCIYDEDPRNHMWNWLKWYHAIPQYYWGGEEFHLTDEGHVDYTFLGCGSAFQIQMESPPFQFQYERSWHEEHGSGVNHICWIVPSAYNTIEHLMSNGCTTRMEYEEFGVYRGYVCADPEGRWIEIMDYIGDFKTPDVEFRPFGIPGLQLFGVTQLTENLAEMSDWYQRVLGLRPIHGGVDKGIVYLADEEYSAERNIAMILAEPGSEAEREMLAKHGPCISGANYQAWRPERADADALAAGFERVSEFEFDERTGLRTSVLREPSGNLVYLREMFDPVA
jgi:catechol 2,3-dioxygenase-like lactoylglutathione lyase family enzyme